MRRAKSKIFTVVAFCMVALVSYVFAGSHHPAAGHKKLPNAKQHASSKRSTSGSGGGGEMGDTAQDPFATPTPMATATPTPAVSQGG